MQYMRKNKIPNSKFQKTANSRKTVAGVVAQSPETSPHFSATGTRRFVPVVCDDSCKYRTLQPTAGNR